MHKIIRKIKKNKNLLYKISFFVFSLLFITIFLILFKHPDIKEEGEEKRDLTLKLLFTGDIFLDRHIDELSQRSKLKYSYPFQGLNTLEKDKYDAWVGNLECPVTLAQSTSYEKENYLKFSCKEEYLPELKKYFDIVSLANNHTDNMGGRKGIEETRKHLDEVGMKYFGDYDNSQKDNICKIIFVKEIPIAFCGFHGVYKLPTENEIEVVGEYSKYFITFVMPHQGVEYESKSNTYQKKIYHGFIDSGADAVFGSHPHVIQETENYKGKTIFYSLGNFIFDQSWVKTREHMAIQTEILLPKYANNYSDLSCEEISDKECLAKAEKLKIVKPIFNLKYTPIFTYSNLDFVTKKKKLSEIEYQKLLKDINFFYK